MAKKKYNEKIAGVEKEKTKNFEEKVIEPEVEEKPVEVVIPEIKKKVEEKPVEVVIPEVKKEKKKSKPKSKPKSNYEIRTGK